MKKIFSLIAAVSIAAITFISCSKDSTTPDPTPTPKEYAYRVDVQVSINEEVREMFDFTGSAFKCGSRNIDLEKALSLADGFGASNLNGDTPSETYLRLFIVPKADFTPQTGQKYNVDIDILYVISVIDKATGEVTSHVTKRGGGEFKNINFDKAIEKGYTVQKVLKSIKAGVDFDETVKVTADGKIITSDDNEENNEEK